MKRSEVHICHQEDEKHDVTSMHVIQTTRNQITCYICIQNIKHLHLASLSASVPRASRRVSHEGLHASTLFVTSKPKSTYSGFIQPTEKIKPDPQVALQ
jgi:hypothetical protein